MTVFPAEPGSPPTSGHGCRIVFIHQSEQLLGGSQLQKVDEAGCETIPNEVYFEIRLPHTQIPRTELQIYGNEIADAIEGVLVMPYVESVAYRQDVSRAGQLLDQLDIFWVLPDESAAGDFVISFARLLQGNILTLIQAQVDPYLPGG